jgi:tripartite-type tricarboxylate transporter receptor subunit TctC
MPALSTFVAPSDIAPNLPVKLPRDFVPIGFTAANPMFIAMNPSLGITTLPQLIALAKKDPGKVTFAVTGVGRVTQLTGELLQAQTGISLLTVPYNAGPAAALADVIGGRVSMIIEGYSGVAASIRSGAIKPIAVSAPERLPEFPDLPTVAETIPGFAASGWQVLVAPLGTPKPIIDKISTDLAKVVSDAALKKKLAAIGSYARAMNPAETVAFVDKEQTTWKPILEKIFAKSK